MSAEGELPEIPASWWDDDKGPGILATSITVSALSTIFTAARLYTRGKLLGKFHLDDYLIVVSLICAWVAVAMACVAVSHGNGRHFLLLSDEQKQAAILWTIVGFPPGIVSFGLPKLAVVALLTRIMNPSRYHKWFLWAMTSLCFALLLVNVGILFGQCYPSNSQWDFSVEGTCWDKWILVRYAIFTGGFSAFVDLYLAIYPACVLAQLKLNIRKKVVLAGALGIGSISAIVAIYKCTRIPSLASDDFSWETSDLVVWTIIEGGTIIIATCIPVLRPLVDQIFGRRAMGGSSSDPHYNYQNYGTDRSGPLRSNDYELGGRRRAPSSGKRLEHIGEADLASVYDPKTRVEKDSQESILQKNSLPVQGIREQPPAKLSRHNSLQQQQQQHHQGIMRTDVFTVSVEDTSKKPRDDRNLKSKY